ncbi:MAG: radical SAM protein [Clostridiales bacterium]|nr:radical SAM protein [Clostridiales bacterium]
MRDHLTIGGKMKANLIPYRKTYSICPVCRKQIPARIVKRKSGWYMEKSCDEHGGSQTIVWRGEKPDFLSWGKYSPPKDDFPPLCPDACGLCSRHLQNTCCVLVEVTKRCNLRCNFCFAESDEDNVHTAEKTPEALFKVFRELVCAGRSFIQLSGGEPTVRDDLPGIIAAAKKAGAESIQLNTNGIRLCDRGFTKELSDAGLSFVFMQFDGLDDNIYQKLRNRPLLKEKLQAIKVCDELGIGVTLVPTIVPGINDHQIGSMIKFALEHSPAVRGIHFQPVSYFGRYPDAPENTDRITLPEIVTAIEEQTGGLVRMKDIAPSACDHPRCGFHGDFVVLPDRLLALTPKASSDCCGNKSSTDEALLNRRFVSRRWKREAGDVTDNPDMSDFDAFLSRVRTHGFTITGMAFQDAYNLDIERLRRCSLHVWSEGKIVPFCSYYC